MMSNVGECGSWAHHCYQALNQHDHDNHVAEKIDVSADNISYSLHDHMKGTGRLICKLVLHSNTPVAFPLISGSTGT